MSKLAVLLLSLIIVTSSIIMVKPAYSVSTPSVPEFTVTLVAHPYDVSPTYDVDPYRGETVIVEEGRHVQNRSIELVIKNQPFTPYEDANGNYIVMSYNVSLKGHYADSWEYYPNAYWKIPLTPSKGDYTVISFGSYYNESDPYSYQWSVPDSGQVDFRVEKRIGYYNETVILVPIPGGEWHRFSFTGESSGWSDTQTLTIGESETPTPNQEPQQIEQIEAIVGAAIAAAVIVVGLGLLIYLIKRK
jgi:hypothetical protein